MKFTIDFQHREFFIKNHAIEFDQLIPPLQLENLQKHFKEILPARGKKQLGKLSSYSSEDFFMVGHDIWREDDFLRKTVTSKTFAEIAAELCERRPLRLAYDQYFPSADGADLSKEYASLISLKPTLTDFSPVQGVVCGLMLCLSRNDEFEDEVRTPTSEVSLFSETPGNGVFFDLQAILNFEDWFSKSRDYLMIVYAEQKAVYIMQTQNPHAHALKKLGYSYGDRLKEKLNPILVR